MDPLLTSAASAIRNNMEALTLAANNLANQNSPGYKADREAYSVVWSDVQAASFNTDSEPAPFGTSTTDQVWTDLSQGQLVETNSDLHLAISGDGFLMAKSPSGPYLTRDGDLRLSANGELRTAQGFTLETVKGLPYRIDPMRRFTIAPDGTVEQDGQRIAQLKIVTTSAQHLRKNGENLFTVRDGIKLQPSGAQVLQGRLEGSNFSAPEAAIRMVTVMRQLESMQRATMLASDMNRSSVDDLAKAGG